MSPHADSKFCLHLSPDWSFEFEDKNIEITGLKPRAVITYLVLEGTHRHQREKVASLLWPDTDRVKARGSLRQILAPLSKRIENLCPDALHHSKDEVGFNPRRIATNYELSLEELKAGSIRPSALLNLAKLTSALAEFEVIGAEFEEWISQTRASILSRTMIDLKSALGEERHSLLVRLRCAETAARLDEFDEDVVRGLMQLQAACGNSVSALKIYGEFCEKLEMQMDAEPSLETQDLAVSIKLSEHHGRTPEDPASSLPAMPAGLKPIATATVAVLPFEELASETIPPHVVLGLLDTITCELATYRAPAVISSNTTRHYVGSVPSPSEIGRAIGADYVVSGLIRTAGSDVAISVQLARASDNHVIWARTHECGLDAFSEIRVPVSHDIVHEIMPAVDMAELRRNRTEPVATLGSYQLVLRAKDLMFKVDQHCMSEAYDLLQQAVSGEPHFAPAHSLLAEWCAISLWQGWSSDSASERKMLEHHLRQAVTLSPGDGRAVALTAHSRMMFDRDYGEALKLLDRAIDLCPNDAETLAWSVPTHSMTRQTVRAIELGERALHLSPLDPFRFRNEHFLATAYYADGQYDRSADLGLSVCRQAPAYASNLRATIAALYGAERADEAVDLVAKHREIAPDFSLVKFREEQGFEWAADRQLYCDHLLAAGLSD